MATTTVVPALDVVEDHGTCLMTAGIALVNALSLQGGKEAFHHRIIVAVATSAYAHLYVFFRQKFLVIVNGILAATAWFFTFISRNGLPTS